MNYKISNQNLFIEISDHGAELKSIKYNNVEYLHDSNPEFWSRSAPLLFPNIGTIKDGKTIINDNEYKMIKHGFLRDRDLQVTNHETSSITFEYQASEEDLKIYPYNFKLAVTYRVNSAKTEVELESEIKFLQSLNILQELKQCCTDDTVQDLKSFLNTECKSAREKFKAITL